MRTYTQDVMLSLREVYFDKCEAGCGKVMGSDDDITLTLTHTPHTQLSLVFFCLMCCCSCVVAGVVMSVCNRCWSPVLDWLVLLPISCVSVIIVGARVFFVLSRLR